MGGGIGVTLSLPPMSRRQQITMGGDEVLAFLEQSRTVTCATHGPRGWPHLMPLWYVLRDGRLWAWTFAKSQKARNIERDPRATLQVEAGEAYAELRGVMLECDVVVHRDVELVTELGVEIFTRYGEGSADEMRQMVERQAPKRIGLEFVELRRATWDHRKLGGVY
jgi:general stress protein 26